METPITVAIVEDTEIIRESLSALVSGNEGFECVGVLWKRGRGIAEYTFDLS